MIRWYFDDFGHLKTPTPRSPRSPARHGSRLIFLNTPLLPSEAAFSNWETSKTTTKRTRNDFSQAPKQAYFAGFTSLKGDFKFKRALVASLTVHVLHVLYVSLCISMYLYVSNMSSFCWKLFFHGLSVFLPTSGSCPSRGLSPGGCSCGLAQGVDAGTPASKNCRIRFFESSAVQADQADQAVPKLHQITYGLPLCILCSTSLPWETET